MVLTSIDFERLPELSSNSYTILVKVAIYPSQNGYGHTQRMISVAQHLICSPRISGINLYLSESNLPIFAHSLKEFGIQAFVATHPNKESEGPWVENVNKSRMETFNEELTICDTVIWPISNSNKSILFANFLWEDYWDYQDSDHKVPFKKYETANALRINGTITYGNACFVTSSVSSSANFTSVPVIDYWGYRLQKRDYRDGCGDAFEVSISLGGTGNMFENVKNALHPMGLKWLPSRNAIEESRKKNSKLIMITRAGVSTISECVSAGVPIICLFDSSDPELSGNAETVATYGWGLAIDVNSGNLMQNVQFAINDIRENYKGFRGRLTSEPVISSEYLAHMMIAEGCN